MSSNFKVTAAESLAKLGKSLENIAPTIERELNSAIKDLAMAAYSEIVGTAQSKLSSTRQDYLKGLEFTDLGDNSYAITLEGTWPTKLEDGFPAYNLTDVLLASKKTVETGSRAGQPWVQENQTTGQKYAYVPMEKKTTAVGGTTGDLAKTIKQMTATNAQGRQQRLTSVFKDAAGLPIEGKVAVARSEDSRLDQLVKYQKVHTNKATGKKTTQGIYINYRVVSEAGDPWIHPGYAGLKAFEQAEKSLVANLEQIIRTLVR